MTLALGLILFGLLLMYGGITGRSIRRLLVGDATVTSTTPAPVQRTGG